MATTRHWQLATTVASNSASLFQGVCKFRELSDDMYIRPDSISVIKSLGEGSFASVDLCSWDGKTVAVKTLKSALLSSERDLKDFLHEAALLKKLSHAAIVNFVGVAIELRKEETAPSIIRSQSSLGRRAVQELGKLMRLKSAKSQTLDHPRLSNEDGKCPEEDNSVPLSQLVEKVMLVQEYMSQGTLKQMVTSQMSSPFKILYSKKQGLEWLIQIAKGLRYLHNAKPKIIHRDLKLENIMLTFNATGQIVAKIGDFGLHAILKDPRQLEKNGSGLETADSLTLRHSVSQEECNTSIKASYDLSGRTGSMMYMAPEVLHCRPYNEKADVFSFGIIMYEVLCKMLILTFVSCQGLPEEVENYAQGIASGNRPKVPEDWPESFSNLLRQCWAQNPEDRPSMNTVVSQLLNLGGDDWICTERAIKGCRCCSMQ